ncbi:Endonuclease/Exonuclease/phosphatase family protein [Gimesia panareensis]|uniref:Endonuclease/Exonuclease/phosphatase family protein n=1 Tax=Gimesia panareensis TaxID=2527978 RepID=A0A518FP89_9PLAN|nr:endonuclease/exonuclease/phosphatase family protein [Gimesia panareensis]QDV18164.1 Endonuclease/Exonuclease/phosphatase family protein [Gimesia panareensis]
MASKSKKKTSFIKSWKLRGLALLLIGLLSGGAIHFGGKQEQVTRWVKDFIASTVSSSTPADWDATEIDLPRSDQTIRIASFNIQVFGVSKMSKPQVPQILARIIQQFDVVAIQEIRAQDQSFLDDFLNIVNTGDHRYAYIVGARQGRTASKEQYAYFYNTDRIRVNEKWTYTVIDKYDKLHRPPYVAHFQTLSSSSENPFSFTLINIHTDPDETDQELNVLDDVYRVVANDGSQEDDVILLGDLNVDDQHLGELGRVADLMWTVSKTPTNTRQSKQYDNILFSQHRSQEFTGISGVYDFKTRFKLSEKEALTVSDHLPVWAEFQITEKGGIRQAGVQGTQPR